MDIVFSRWKPQWRADFRDIKADLTNGLTKKNVSYLAIEHVGSTSIAHLIAKPMLDILIVVADADFNEGHRERLKEVLCFSWDLHDGGYSFKGESSIRGRWNFTLQGVMPERKIAIVAENSIYRRSCLALRDTLKIDCTYISGLILPTESRDRVAEHVSGKELLLPTPLPSFMKQY